MLKADQRASDVEGRNRNWGAVQDGRTTAVMQGKITLAKVVTPSHSVAESKDPLFVLSWRDENAAQRIRYPRYRRAGLPVTSSLAESLVKQVSKRVKGTEKFWNNGPSGEAILQLRAAVLSDDDRLQHWIYNRPISSFSPRCRLTGLANST